MSYVQFIIGFIVSSILWGLVGIITIDHLDKKVATLMQLQVKADNLQCSADKRLTEGVSSDYQKKISDLNNQLALRRMQSPHCIVPTAFRSPRTPAGAKSNKHDEKNGVNTASLYDFAGECEQHRLQLISLQDFIRRTWAAKGVAPLPTR